MGLSWWLSGKESTCQYRGHGFDPWSRKIPHATGQLSPCATTPKACELQLLTFAHPRAHASQQEKPLQ